MSWFIHGKSAVGVLVWGAIALPSPTARGQESLSEEITALREAMQQQKQQYDQLVNRLEELETEASEEAATAERIDAVETMLFDLDERVGSRGLVRGFNAQQIDLGGFLTQQFTVASGDGQTESSFNATQFELLIGADVTDNLSMFAALGFLREADLDFSTPSRPSFRGFANRTPNIISWANYRVSDKLEVRAGRYVTPMGIINIEHFPPVLLDVNQPQFLRPFSGSTIFPNFMTGGQLHGKFFLGEQGKDVLSYNVFAGAFNGGSNAENTNLGARIQYEFGDTGLTVGANYLHGMREGGATPSSQLGNFSIVPATSLTANDYDVFGVDVLYDKKRILWKTEFFFSNEQDADDRLAFYTQPAYRITDKWITFYRFDFLDPGQGLDESIEHMVGVNYLPVPTLRIRGVYVFKQFDSTSENANIFQASATFSF